MRRFAAPGLVLGLIVVLFVSLSPSAAHHLSSLTALAARVADLEQRVEALEGGTEPAPAPSPTQEPSPSPTPEPSPVPTPAPAPTTGGFPDAASTGVPAGTTLTTYGGPLTITTAGTTVDAKRITGTLIIRAADVTVTRSHVTGNVRVDSGSLTISDSDIDAGDRAGTGLEPRNYTAVRVHIRGGNRSAYCADNCTIRDSYVHGQMSDETGTYHESGIRMEQNTTLIGNTIACDAPDFPPDAGCSAGLTGYGDFAPVRNNLIQGNYFPASTGGACAYGGSSRGKPYSADAANIRFIDNVFERNPSSERGTTCGYWFTIADWDGSAPGNEWTNNRYVDGAPVVP